jgi:cytoskeletal protein RodZ
MSAPDTNIEKQKRRHWAPLLGSALVVVFGIAMLLWWAFDQAAAAPGPDSTAPAETSGGTAPAAGSGAPGAAATRGGTTGGPGNTRGSQPGVRIDQGNGSGTPATVGSPPPAGSGAAPAAGSN